MRQSGGEHERSSGCGWGSVEVSPGCILEALLKRLLLLLLLLLALDDAPLPIDGVRARHLFLGVGSLAAQEGVVEAADGGSEGVPGGGGGSARVGDADGGDRRVKVHVTLHVTGPVTGLQVITVHQSLRAPLLQGPPEHAHVVHTAVRRVHVVAEVVRTVEVLRLRGARR